MPSLSSSDGGGPVTRCAICHARDAAGPCARCKRSVCGDCCELSTGGATTFAVCLTCIQRGGASLKSGWWGLLGWLGAIAIALVALGCLLLALRRH